MRLIESHCHLDDLKSFEDFNEEFQMLRGWVGKNLEDRAGLMISDMSESN